MDDNFNETKQDDPANTQPEQPSEAIIPAVDPNVPDSKQQPTNMEVHHHPDLHHSPKKWKEYFLEFLMIFLAVTMGFFAETIREHISATHREKDYIAGLINNAKTDTSNLNELIRNNDLELKGIDTLLKISDNYFGNVSVQDSIFFYAFNYTLNLEIFTFNDLTLVQLRNAGGYSLIKTDKVADSIALYEYKNNSIILQEKFYTDGYTQTWASLKQVFDGKLTNKFYRSYIKTQKIPGDIKILITKDEEKMHVFFNNYWTFAITLKAYNIMLKEHLEYLTGFINFLNREYDLR